MTLSASRVNAERTRSVDDNHFAVVRMAYGPVTAEIEETRGHLMSFWHELGKLVAVEDNEERAEAGYDRYVAASDGRSFFSGDKLIGWDDLPEPVRQSWIAAFTE